MSQFRVVTDSMGDVSVPADAKFSAQTQRALDNFQISSLTLPGSFIDAVLHIKRAAAEVNAELGVLEADCVVLAAGAGSAALAERLGISLPMENSEGLLIHSNPMPPVLHGLVLSPGLHMKQDPNGRIVAATTDPYQTEHPDHLAYHKANREQGRMSGRIRLRVRYRAVKGPWFDYLLVSKAELESILQGTGWHLAATIDSDEKPQYIVILEKI